VWFGVCWSGLVVCGVCGVCLLIGWCLACFVGLECLIGVFWCVFVGDGVMWGYV